MKKLLAILLMLALSISFVACSDDDDDNPTQAEETDAWVGTWLSAGANVAPILAGDLFNLDSVRVTMTEDGTVKTEQHVKDGAWVSFDGVYTITESSDTDIHSVKFVYSAFEQEGIIQITDGNPDQMKLEAVQTVPDYGFVPRTPESGFGSDPVYGTLNIQTYVRID